MEFSHHFDSSTFPNIWTEWLNKVYACIHSCSLSRNFVLSKSPINCQMVNPAEDLLKHCLGETLQLHVHIPRVLKKKIMHIFLSDWFGNKIFSRNMHKCCCIFIKPMDKAKFKRKTRSFWRQTFDIISLA